MFGDGCDLAANVGSDRLGSAAATSATDRIVTAFSFKTHTPNAIQSGLSLGALLQRRSQSGVTAHGESKWQELVVWPRSPKRNSLPNKARARLGFSRVDDKCRRTRACEKRHALQCTGEMSVTMLRRLHQADVVRSNAPICGMRRSTSPAARTLLLPRRALFVSTV